MSSTKCDKYFKSAISETESGNVHLMCILHLRTIHVIFNLGFKSGFYRIELVHSLSISGKSTIEYLRERVFQTRRNERCFKYKWRSFLEVQDDYLTFFHLIYYNKLFREKI